jgi:hypothetical protein
MTSPVSATSAADVASNRLPVPSAGARRFAGGSVAAFVRSRSGFGRRPVTTPSDRPGVRTSSYRPPILEDDPAATTLPGTRAGRLAAALRRMVIDELDCRCDLPQTPKGLG